MFSWRSILLPFSWLFGLMVIFRNFLFDKKVLNSYQYPKPIFCVGNIRVGGTGKTPFTEFLIRKFLSRYRIAVVSRGYGRSSQGFLEVKNPNPKQYGDEPSQFKAKFPEVLVIVSEDRNQAIRDILPKFDILILDDAYQHRRVSAGFNWVLMEFSDLSKPIWLFPAGNYREGIMGLNRAQSILITKCPNEVTKLEQGAVRKKLNLNPRQNLFFSSIHYLPIQRLKIDLTPEARDLNPQEKGLLDSADFILVFTGIAGTYSLKQFLSSKKGKKEYISFLDHHEFTLTEIQQIKDRFHKVEGVNKIILTTEKDAQRLNLECFNPFIHEYPVYFQPIEFKIQSDQEDDFQELIENYVESNL